MSRITSKISQIILFLSLVALGNTELWAKNSKKTKLSAKPIERKPTADEIVKNFTFIGDFDIKDETRNNSTEIFWRYPSTIPKVNFEMKLEQSPEKLKANFPITMGQGRAIEHLNTGRNLFLEGNYEDARQTWLSGRARFGKNYDYHRRNDYFIASAFLYKSYKNWLANGKKWDVPELRQDFVNGNSFLSAAFDKKKDIADDLLDSVAPNAYYNQAVVLYNYERWAGVVGSATLGLDFLRKTGRTEHRRDFHRMLAETSIRGQDYLEAVRAIDLTLRQDQDSATSASLFARVGDIYFVLNNFELAEEVYEAANRIDNEHRQIKPSQFVLRGESLFWMGRFEEARKHLQYALNSQSSPRADEVLGDDMQALASLRIADTYLAEKNMEKAKVAYFTHTQDFRGHPTENFAKLRLACLELP
ncbi:MAG: tetratricopeptide repeat protein, partial [Bdellovibrionota bacterium]